MNLLEGSVIITLAGAAVSASLMPPGRTADLTLLGWTAVTGLAIAGTAIVRRRNRIAACREAAREAQRRSSEIENTGLDPWEAEAFADLAGRFSAGTSEEDTHGC